MQFDIQSLAIFIQSLLLFITIIYVVFTRKIWNEANSQRKEQAFLSMLSLMEETTPIRLAQVNKGYLFDNI
ncbi:MAG: hypothetical protein JJV92_03490 [Desulfosarcina sp.]|nr:hypothetical protein [Desulfobacterales bacterium]